MNYLHHELNDIKTATSLLANLLAHVGEIDATRSPIDKLIDEADSLLHDNILTERLFIRATALYRR